MTTVDIYRSPRGRQAVEAAYEEMLGRWPVPARRLTVPTRLGDTFVMASGPRAFSERNLPGPGAGGIRSEERSVVLLHGSGTNAAMWIADVAAWAEHFRVYAVDIVGEPGHSAPSRPPLGSGDYAGWLDDVFDGLGLARAALVGASLGGWLAIDYATRRPRRVERLVCTCPGGVGRQKMGWLLPVLLLRPFGRWGMRRSLAIAAGLGPEVGPFLDYMTLIQRHFRPRTQRLPIFPDATLAALTMPVLVIAGDRDAMLDSHDTVRRLNNAVPHAVTTLLPGVRHSIVGQTASTLEFLRS